MQKRPRYQKYIDMLAATIAVAEAPEQFAGIA
jgi:hypothetical protein